MKASKFTEAQKAFILKQGEEGTPVVEICRKAGIGQSTYSAWKKKYSGLLPDEMLTCHGFALHLRLESAPRLHCSPVIPPPGSKGLHK